MVTSGMDPHTIRVSWIGMARMVGSCSLGQTATVDFVVGLMSHFEEK
jgi:hypothetical protein